MELIFVIPLLFIPLIIGLNTGLMARGYGRKFLPWFFTGIFLPFIANIILICLPVNREMRLQKIKPVGEEKLLSHLFFNTDSKKNIA